MKCIIKKYNINICSMYKKAQVCYYYENEKCIMTINLDYEKDEDYGNK